MVYDSCRCPYSLPVPPLLVDPDGRDFFQWLHSAKHVRRFLCSHDSRGIQISIRDYRKNGCVDHSQIFDAAHAAVRTQHGHLIVFSAYLTGTGWMVSALDVPTHPCIHLLIQSEINRRLNLVAAVGIQCRLMHDFAAELEAGTPIDAVPLVR